MLAAPFPWRLPLSQAFARYGLEDSVPFPGRLTEIVAIITAELEHGFDLFGSPRLAGPNNRVMDDGHGCL